MSEDAGQSRHRIHQGDIDPRGEAHRRRSITFGIIGFFVLGLVFGPLAIINANRAEGLGREATLGLMLGWVDVIVGASYVFIFAGFAVIALTA